MIKWQESYSLGVTELDEQHKNLFVFSNDIDGILQDRDVSGKELADALKFLGEYVADHFHLEEKCMHDHACQIAEKNKFAHEKFIQTYKALEKRIDQDDDAYSILAELHRFLENWLVEHICKIDVQLKPCIH